MNHRALLDEDMLASTANPVYEDFTVDENSTGPWEDSVFCSPEEGPLLKSFKTAFMPVAYSLICFIGLLGNILVLLVLVQRKGKHASTDTFLLHLAAADLLSASMLPAAVIEGFSGWTAGPLFCKVVIAAHKIIFYCASLLLACIAVDRYMAISRAVQGFGRKRGISLHLICATVWLTSFLFALPELLFASVDNPVDGMVPRCIFSQETPSATTAWFAARFSYHIVGFLLPMLVMLRCYAGVIHCLAKRPGTLHCQRAVKVAILVTVVFFLCWSPYHVVIFLDTVERLKVESGNCGGQGVFPIAITVCEFLGFTHCCITPFLYTLTGVKFRRDLSQVLDKFACTYKRARVPVCGKRHRLGLGTFSS